MTEWPWDDLGNLPDWLQAIGATGALFYIAIQHHRDRAKERAARIESAQERRAQEARQARLISVSVGYGGYGLRDGYVLSIGVQNDSPDLIRHLKVVVESLTGRDLLDHTFGSQTQSATTLSAGDRRDFTARPTHQPAPRKNGNDNTGFEELERVLRVGVEFTDAQGLRWLQTADGNPHPRP